eukprot:TRINITY_DN6634_c0_g1_i1.p1 TRINITY_DN6634_c0_g1~~TRINITY_DN6634_c0_g1_i1.p1  ORF type:complete len:637 (+),score=104.01 TRINITY_DN6634_c0_g1_i1:978-2888(+)
MRASRSLLTSHRSALQKSISDPEGFWGVEADKLVWDKKPDMVLNRGDLIDTWFPGGKLNICYNAVDAHVDKGNGNDISFRYDSPVTGTKKNLTYAELQEEVSRIASTLIRHGVKPGDRVLLYMSMTLEAVCTMLASVRIGAVHAVCFGGFAPRELAKRIKDASPAVIVASSCGLPGIDKVVDYKTLLDEAIQLLNMNIPCIVHRRDQLVCDLQKGQFDFYDEVSKGSGQCDPVSVPSDHPSYIMYTSGTTGMPKGVVRDTAGYATVLKWSMKSIFNVGPKETIFTASDIGWVVGHSYIVYAPLLGGAQTVLYEGKPVGTPDAASYFRVVSEHKAKAMFAAPTSMRAIRKEDPSGELVTKYDLSSLAGIFLAGERTDLSTLAFFEEKLKKPVYDHWWQTESGWPITAPCTGLEPGHDPVKGVPNEGAGLPVPGWKISVKNEEDLTDLEDDTEMGKIVVERPLPPGMTNRLWSTSFVDTYMQKNMYISGDAGYKSEKGFIHILSRTDDIMNVAGVRLSTGMIEEAVTTHPSIAEAIVIGKRDDFKGEVPFCVFVLKAGETLSSTIKEELDKIISKDVGGFARLGFAVPVPRLPKTRSGKVLRGTIRKMVNSSDKVEVPSTIEDPQVLDEIEAVIKEYK